MDDFDADFEKLIGRLEDMGGGVRPVEVVRVSLMGSAEDRLSFDDAWACAINRIQPSEIFGDVHDEVLIAALREDRALLEEDRGVFQAAYEHREPTPRELGVRTAAMMTRLDLPPRPRARARRRPRIA